MFRVKEFAELYGVHRDTMRKYLKQMFGDSYGPLNINTLLQFMDKHGPPTKRDACKRIISEEFANKHCL